MLPIRAGAPRRRESPRYGGNDPDGSRGASSAAPERAPRQPERVALRTRDAAEHRLDLLAHDGVGRGDTAGQEGHEGTARRDGAGAALDAVGGRGYPTGFHPEVQPEPVAARAVVGDAAVCRRREVAEAARPLEVIEEGGGVHGGMVAARRPRPPSAAAVGCAPWHDSSPKPDRSKARSFPSDKG